MNVNDSDNKWCISFNKYFLSNEIDWKTIKLYLIRWSACQWRLNCHDIVDISSIHGSTNIINASFTNDYRKGVSQLLIFMVFCFFLIAVMWSIPVYMYEKSIRLYENMIESYWVRFLSVFFLMLWLTRLEFELRNKFNQMSLSISDHGSQLQDRIRIKSTNLNDNTKICRVEHVIMILFNCPFPA